MQTYYTKWYSPSVGREMEIKVYGHAGRRLCLRATSISFAHPSTGKTMTFNVDEDFEEETAQGTDNGVPRR
jgi:esterase/lipase superfamily enzyme